MATITLSVPDELKIKMEETEIINWSSVARRAFAEELKNIERLNMLREITLKSNFKENEAKELFNKLIKGFENIKEKRVKDWEKVKNKQN